MEKIKIAQIGVTHEHAAGVMATLRNMPEVFEIAGYVDDSDSTAPKHPGGWQKTFEGLKKMTMEEVFAIPELQGVVIETPNTELVPTAIRCMEHNLPMHMDKPAGEDAALFQILLDGCRTKNLPLQMGYMFRGNPAFQFCLKITREKWLGDIFEIECDMNHSYGNDLYQTYLGKFKGGIMFNLGCHLIDFIVAMMGAPDTVVAFLKSTPDVAPEIKNNCLAILEYPHATAVIRCCSRGDLSHRTLKISGTKGWLELSPLERFDNEALLMKLSLREDRPGYAAGFHVLDFGVRHDRYLEQMNEFASLIRGEIRNPYDYDHDALVEKVLLAASGYTVWKKETGIQ